MINNMSVPLLLTLFLWHTCRDEPVEAQIAMANMIKNRIGHYGNDAIWRHELIKAFKEFSIKEVSELPRNTDGLLNQLTWVANGVLYKLLLDNTNGALYCLTGKEYYGKVDHPSWARVGNMKGAYKNLVFFGGEDG